MNACASLLTPDWVALVAGGVSTIVSSCDGAHRPSVMRAVGCRIAADGTHITVYLARRQSRQLLQDLATTGRIAVVFSQPYSHRTLQVKAGQVQLRPAVAADQPALSHYLHGMEEEVSRVNFTPAFTRAMLAYTLDDLVAVEFVPAEAFDQTPGPRAGMALERNP